MSKHWCASVVEDNKAKIVADEFQMANISNSFYSARNARIASAVLATAIPSVRLSVRYTPVLCQNDGT